MLISSAWKACPQGQVTSSGLEKDTAYFTLVEKQVEEGFW
jgi:hypothetical protein